jgi:hypothetical protein
MIELFKGVNLKKVGNISLIVAISVIAYYSLSAYKVYLEIKEAKKINE